jgi:hypothetical protein
MAFIRTRIIKGKPYTYLEERWRDNNGKVRSRSTLLNTKTTGRQDAMERYRQVLRDNVYLYGKSRPGDRYAAVSQAREQYQRFLDFEKTGAPTTRAEAIMRLASGDPYSVDSRERAYQAGHATPQARAKEAYTKLHDTIRAENAAESNQPDQAPACIGPTDEQEAQHQDRVDGARDANDRAYAEYAESAPGADAPTEGSNG